ncbi:MATE family efflux transporter [Caenimonas sp. SL110]|uniref:MATE family efflux transporter n=1 Tax=Caenimonas sp. SL110 TaxID=1450524 RepID=UPI000654708F|nr:MATE family efflux transporter [Caenimonas sp. SL110]
MSELRVIARHAGTVLVGQLAVMAFGITDTIIAGRYSDQALAALSVGAAVYITFFVAMMGILQAMLPIWGQLRGAGRNREVGKSVRQSLYLAGIGMAIGCTALLFPGPILDWTEVPLAVRKDVESYLAILALAMPPALLFRLYSTLNQSLGKPQLVTWLQAASLVVKVPLTIWFAFGGLGVPAMGVNGCAWATVLVNYIFLGCAMWLLRTQSLYEPYAIWHRIERPHWATLAEFARLGIPAGLAIMVEVTSFTLMALFIARQGTVASAAHQIAANLAAVMYMVPLSLAIATSARVSYWLGAEDAKAARAAIRAGFRLALMLALTMAALLFVLRYGIASIYTRNPAVAATAAGLLAWLAVYHLSDATQAMCVFVLRCYRVAIAPLVAYCVLLWGVGLFGGYLLAYRGLPGFEAQNTPSAFWIAGAFALALLSAILVAMVWRAVRAGRH